MRKPLALACVAVVLLAASPAHAQLRTDASALRQGGSPRLYSAGTGFTLNKLFSPEHFRMAQSIEFSSSAWGGQTSSLGMYTNSLMWQFDQKLAARVDVSVAKPFGAAQGLFGQQSPTGARVFVQNAEVAYRPSKSVQLNFSYRQSPYGAYASPYGYGSGYGSPYGVSRSARLGLGEQDLFWRDAR